MVPILKLNDSAISVSAFEIVSAKVKLIGPIAVSQSIPTPIELLIFLFESKELS